MSRLPARTSSQTRRQKSRPNPANFSRPALPRFTFPTTESRVPLERLQTDWYVIGIQVLRHRYVRRWPCASQALNGLNLLYLARYSKASHDTIMSMSAQTYSVNCPQCNAVASVVCPRPGATPQQVKEVTPLLNKASATTAVACPKCDHHFSVGWYF